MIGTFVATWLDRACWLDDECAGVSRPSDRSYVLRGVIDRRTARLQSTRQDPADLRR